MQNSGFDQVAGVRHIRVWAGIFLAAGLIARLVLSFQGLEFQVNYGPAVDDSFYSLKIARNIAAGKGFTFDGIHETNGFQPLYVFLMVPVFKLFPEDLLHPLQAALAMLSLFNIAAGFLLFRVIRSRYGDKPAMFGLGIWCFSPYVVENGLSGLETSIAAFFMIAALDFYMSRIRDGARSWKDDLVFSIIIALSVFSRIDCALFALALGLDYILKPSAGLPRFSKRLIRMAAVAALAVAFYGPWLLFNYFHFGSLLPESGSAVRYISQLYGSHLLPLDFPDFEPGHAPMIFYIGNLKKTLHVLAQHPIFFPATTLSYIFKVFGILSGMFFLDSWPVHLLFVAAGLFMFWLSDKDWRALTLFVLIMLAAYNFYVFGFWFFYRYFYPVEMVFIIMGAGIFYRLDKILRAKNFRLLLPIAAFLFIIIFAENGFRMFGFRDDFNVSYYYNLSQGIDRATPPGSRIGAFQAGTMGYFSKREIINLDGVVNAQALSALKENRFLEYIRSERIDYVIDSPDVIRLLLFRRAGGDPSESMVKIFSDEKNTFELYQVRPRITD